MKKQDLYWLLMFIGFSMLIAIPYTRTYYELFNEKAPYLMGFIKTMILASLGERLVSRIKYGSYFRGDGFILKALIWGFLGMVFVLIFPVFYQGVLSAQQHGLLPGNANGSTYQTFILALLTSILMNVWFAPTFMMLHRITDAYIELAEGNPKAVFRIPFSSVLKKIDFQLFFKFIILKTIPFFWIPAHTITFLLPGGYRVLFAAYLSLALGILLSLKGNKSKGASDGSF